MGNSRLSSVIVSDYPGLTGDPILNKQYQPELHRNCFTEQRTISGGFIRSHYLSGISLHLAVSITYSVKT